LNNSKQGAKLEKSCLWQIANKKYQVSRRRESR